MKERSTKEDELEIIARCLRRARSIVAGFFGLSLLAAIGTAWFWQAGLFGKGQGSHVFGAVAVGSLLVIAVKLGLLLYRRAAIEDSEVYQLLRDQPGRVLWTFPAALRTKLPGFDCEAEQIIILCADDARIERIRGVRKTDVPRVMTAIRRLTPNAYHGLTDANRRRYKKATGFDVE